MYEANRTHAHKVEKLEQATSARAACMTLLDATPEAVRGLYFPLLEQMRAEALGEHTLTVESADNREKDMRDFLQARIDAEQKKIDRLRDGIIRTMQNYVEA